MKIQSRFKLRRAAGFTLLEMVIVLGIIAVLVGGSIALIGGVGEGAKIQRVRTDFQTIGSALNTYKLNGGSYPTTAQGLMALVEKPKSTPIPRDWVRVSKKVPTDPWQNPYIYKFPGSKEPAEIELISKGPDGIEKTSDDLSSQDD